ncbi:hypothetical protein LPJ75_004598, partial [Coemansia sp. RSA 2598]
SLVRASGPDRALYSVAVGVSVVAQPERTSDAVKDQTDVVTDTEDMPVPQSDYAIEDLGIAVGDNPAQSAQEMSHTVPTPAAATTPLATSEGMTFGHTVFFGHAVNRSSDPPSAQQKSAHLSPEDLVGGSVNLSFRNLSQVLSGIALYAQSIQSLVLSNNALCWLPDAIGHLHRLQTLDVANNELRELPATIAYCQGLECIYVGANRLSDLPSSIRHLRRLKELDLRDNRLTSVPACLWTMPSLELLDLSNNPIECLPSRMFGQDGVAALNTERPLKLVVDGCPLKLELADTSGPVDRSASFPSLVETIVCRMVNSNAAYPLEIPDHLRACLEDLVSCDHCHRLYPAGKGFKRRRILLRNKTALPVEYNLCRPHWDTDDQRIALLFASRSPESVQPYSQFKQAAMQSVSARVARRGSSGRITGSIAGSIGDSRRAMGDLFGLKAVCRSLKAALFRPGKRGSDTSSVALAEAHQTQTQENTILAVGGLQAQCAIKSKRDAEGKGRSRWLSSQRRQGDVVRLWQHFEDDVPELARIA